MRRRLGVLASVLLLAGCSGDPSPEPQADEPSASETAAPLTKAEVNAAIKAFSKAESGSYDVRGTLIEGAPEVTHTGKYDLSSGYVDQLTTPNSNGGPPSIVRSIAIKQDTWISIDSPTTQTCWMHFEPEDSQAFGVELGAGTTFGIPPVAYVVSTLEAGDDGTVTSDLYSVLLMFSAKTPRQLGIAPNSDHRVPVTLDLDADGAITDVTVSPDQLVGAVEDAGIALGPLGNVRDSLAVSVSLADYGEKVDVVRPPKALTVEVTDDQAQFEADSSACAQRLADSS